jgi:ADP-ribose pyrophosphatase YjhB (NUDIX family)
VAAGGERKREVDDVTETSAEKPVQRSVSIAIGRAENAGEVLIVRRPPDDAELPNLWGLPAATLRKGETWEDAARRAAMGKLGVGIEVQRELHRGRIERKDYVLEMRLLRARISEGTPTVPQADTSVTQYADWRWGQTEDLVPAAEKGSLCSRLYIASGQGK